MPLGGERIDRCNVETIERTAGHGEHHAQQDGEDRCRGRDKSLFAHGMR
jgi:hypothetical protein